LRETLTLMSFSVQGDDSQVEVYVEKKTLDSPPLLGNEADDGCSSPACGCGAAGVPRRQFIQMLGGVAAASLLSRQHAMAGPFEASDFAKLVPPDKKLSPDWIKLLYLRGQPAVYRGKDLETIGMPIGGICAGLLYLGGDGKLWLWAVMNQEYEGILANGSDGMLYAHPLQPVSPVKQGFSLQIRTRAGSKIRHLDRSGWKDIAFQGQYPLGTVSYSDPDAPVSVQLQAYSPFIPLNTDDSSLPATVMTFTLKNHSEAPVEATLAGWMQNAVALNTEYKVPVVRRNRIRQDPSLTFLECGMDTVDPSATPQHDHGSMGIGILTNPEEVSVFSDKALEFDPDSIFAGSAAPTEENEAAESSADRLIGGLKFPIRLAPGGTQTVSFVVTWHFKHLKLSGIEGAETGRHYATRFTDAYAVAKYVDQHFPRIQADTLLWHDTWYNGTLPHWFLERTVANASILATTTCYRFGTGRFYGWEGVGCCPGTCTHVWSYAQAAARLFPELERTTREMVDYGIGFDTKTGRIDYRAEAERGEAIDGQAGTILRTLREHQMSAGSRFLEGVWPRTKQALEFLMRRDANQDGIIQGSQHNTMDADWYGEIAWISSLYVAALLAGEQMATEMNDSVFAARCRQLADRGNRSISEQLFNGEYFVQKPDPDKPDVIGSYGTCAIDQVFGQSWAWQVGLGRVLDRQKTLSALNSLWRYNFTPDVGPFRRAFPAGRWYALPGEAGLIMATNPSDAPNPYHADWHWSVGHFNECMTGFEYQVASHMIAEGMVEQGLAVTRAVHDRYHASRRNPWNEIECGDHYARAMASYGTFVSMCGFEYHGPKQHIGFAPRMGESNFSAAFVAAEGWGTFSQKIKPSTLDASLEVKWGRVWLQTIALRLPEGRAGTGVSAVWNKTKIPARADVAGQRVTIALDSPVELKSGDILHVALA
jgi:non-lysosomal glucosylceramidase